MQNSIFTPSSFTELNAQNSKLNSFGVKGVCTAGQTTNVDKKLDDDTIILEGIFLVKNGAWGDYCHFQIYDKDSILPAPYTGQVIEQYVTGFYVQSDRQFQCNVTSATPRKIPAGLYLRAVYVSVGQTDAELAVNYRSVKVLY